MFLVTKKNRLRGKTYEYVQVIENYRDKGKVKQRVILNVGRRDRVDPQEIAKLIRVLEKLTDEVTVLTTNDPEVESRWSKDHGLPLLYQHLWERVGLQEMVRDLARGRGHEFDIERALFLLVLNRLMDPKSELGISRWKETGLFLSTTLATIKEGDFHDLDLQHLYRTLDFVEEAKKTVEIRLFEKTCTLFNSSVTLVFFDTTSTYYEGSGKGSKELLAYGRSKDHRGDRKQLVIGVLMDQQGIPLGCAVKPGNTQDAALVKELITEVKTRFQLKDIVWVSDGGTSGEDMIGMLKDINARFILGARMRNVKEIYDKIRDEKTREEIMAAMTPIVHGGKKNDDREPLRAYAFSSETHPGRQYVIVHNPREAAREQKTRAEVVARLREALTRKQGVKDLIANKAYKKYLTVRGKKSVQIDEEKIREDEQYDGLFVLQTDAELTTETTVLRYKDLYQVEQAFRYLKSGLDVRPIFHHKDERITAHVFVNFLALYLECALERMLRQQGLDPEQIVTGLDGVRQMRITEFTLKRHVYHVRTEANQSAQAIFECLQCRAGKRVVRVG